MCVRLTTLLSDSCQSCARCTRGHPSVCVCVCLACMRVCICVSLDIYVVQVSPVISLYYTLIWIYIWYLYGYLYFWYLWYCVIFVRYHLYVTSVWYLYHLCDIFYSTYVISVWYHLLWHLCIVPMWYPCDICDICVVPVWWYLVPQAWLWSSCSVSNCSYPATRSASRWCRMWFGEVCSKFLIDGSIQFEILSLILWNLKLLNFVLFKSFPGKFSKVKGRGAQWAST